MLLQSNIIKLLKSNYKHLYLSKHKINILDKIQFYLRNINYTLFVNSLIFNCNIL